MELIGVLQSITNFMELIGVSQNVTNFMELIRLSQCHNFCEVNRITPMCHKFY